MRKKSGFTLVEAMVSMLMISLMVVTIIGVFPQVRKGFANSEARVNAAFVGKSLMDGLRSRGFSNVAASTGTVTLSGLNNGLAATQTIDYAVNVQNISSGQKQVWIVLTWSTGKGSGRLTMETIMVNL